MIDESSTIGSGVGDLTLPDGTSASSIIDFEHRTVSHRLMSDPGVFEWELVHIFARSWLAVAHESELTRPGDFVARRMGADPVIVTRDANGGINVVLNSCTHRGTPVCPVEMGNAQRFKCPYHGWVFDLGGSLVGVTAEKAMYGDTLDKSALGLRRARVAIAYGWIFATWDDTAPALDEFLNASRQDDPLRAVAESMEAVGPPHRWVIRANWKHAAQQSAGDAYHNISTHLSLREMGYLPKWLDDVWRDQRTNPNPGPQTAEEMFAIEGTGDLFHRRPRNLGGLVFPNLSMWYFPPNPAANGTMTPLISPHMWNPLGPDRMEVVGWVLVPRDASDDFKDLSRRTSAQTFGSAGIFQMDDSLMWEEIQLASSGYIGRQQRQDYRATLGLTSRSGAKKWGYKLEYDEDAANAAPPIKRWPREDGIWAFWLHWLEFMVGRPWY